VPRTATVTAATPCRLLTLRSQDFLAAVTGSPSGTTIAAEVASSHLARDGRPGPAVKDA
jgi:CRP-like cAMP-binding protein